MGATPDDAAGVMGHSRAQARNGWADGPAKAFGDEGVGEAGKGVEPAQCPGNILNFKRCKGLGYASLNGDTRGSPDRAFLGGDGGDELRYACRLPSHAAIGTNGV